MSTNYSAGAFNVSMLLMRLVFGILMMTNGYDKLIGFSGMKNDFMNFMGMGSTTSLILVVFAEFFCALFLVLGLFTRLSAIPLVICMGVALFKAHNMDILGDGSSATLYLGAYLIILLLGPGKFSVDGLSGN
jgi:putative oxidoreductase